MKWKHTLFIHKDSKKKKKKNMAVKSRSLIFSKQINSTLQRRKSGSIFQPFLTSLRRLPTIPAIWRPRYTPNTHPFIKRWVELPHSGDRIIFSDHGLAPRAPASSRLATRWWQSCRESNSFPGWKHSKSNSFRSLLWTISSRHGRSKMDSFLPDQGLLNSFLSAILKWAVSTNASILCL